MIKRDSAIRGLALGATEATYLSAGQMLERRNFQPFLKRVAKVGLGKTLRYLVPNSIDVSGEDYKKIAVGGEQVVYSNGSEVLKVIHRSLTLDKQVAEAIADQHNHEQTIMSPHLGEHLTPTEFDIRKIKASLYAAIAVQPHVSIKESFRDVHHLVGYSDSPAHLASLEAFYDALIRLYQATGLQMDLNGTGNVALIDRDDPQLAMIDTLPVSSEMQRIEDPVRHTKLGETLLSRLAVIQDAVSGATEWPESREVVLH